jgi:hypothetical protein
MSHLKRERERELFSGITLRRFFGKQNVKIRRGKKSAECAK